MFAKFKLTGQPEINVNATLVRAYGPGTVEGHTKIDFLGGESLDVPFSQSAVRGAFKRALREHQQNYPVTHGEQPESHSA